MSTEEASISVSVTGHATVFDQRESKNIVLYEDSENSDGKVVNLAKLIEDMFCLERSCDEASLGHLRVTIERVESPSAEERRAALCKKPRRVRNSRGKITHVIS